MGAELGRRAVDLVLPSGDGDGKADGPGLDAIGQRERPYQAHLRHMRIGQDFRVGIDRRAGHAAAIHLGEPFADGTGGESGLEQAGQRDLIARPLELAVEARIRNQLRQADRLGDFAPERVVAGRDDEIIVLRAIGLVGRVARMGRADARGSFTGAEILARL